MKVLLVAGASVVAAAAVTWALWPQPAATPHARQYLQVTACLLTGPEGIAPGTPGAGVWTAMQSASLATHVMVSYLPDGDAADAPVMLNTMIERRCGVIIVAGAPAGQVIGAAKAHPHQRFLLVTAAGAAAAAAPANTVVVSAADAPRRIGQTIHALAAAA